MEPELRDLEESNSSKGGWLSSLMKRSKESEESRDSGVHVKASPSPARTKSRDSTGAESAEGSKSDKHGSYEDIKFVLSDSLAKLCSKFEVLTEYQRLDAWNKHLCMGPV